MKLAEALQERADLNKKIAQLKTRLVNNALVQEGEKPAEDPADLMHELDESVLRLKKLICAINEANCRTLAGGRSLTSIIAEKDVLTVQVAAYRDLIDQASGRVNRYGQAEIKILSTVDVPSLQKKADAISRQIRLLDNTLQECNWNTDIGEI